VIDSGVPFFEPEPLTDSSFVEGEAWERYLRNRFGVHASKVESKPDDTPPSSPLGLLNNSFVGSAAWTHDLLKNALDDSMDQSFDDAVDSGVSSSPSIDSPPVKEIKRAKKNKMPRQKRRVQYKKVAEFGRL
jgi:hypothetical protein